MIGYIITEDFIELKRLYKEGNIDKFENKISSYTADDLYEFAAYFTLDISLKDEYYNVKIISEITYNLVLKESLQKMIDLLFLLLNIGEDVFIYLVKKDCGRTLLNMEISFMNIH